MKNGKKIMYVLATAVLATLVSCGGGNTSSASSAPVVSSSSEAHVHAFGNWEIVTAPTEDAKGSAKRTCSCGESETVEVAKLTDTTVWTATVTPATHLAAGKTVYTSVYGTVEVAIPQVAHTFGNWVFTKTPTEAAEGSAKRTCSAADGGIERVTVAKLTDTTVWTLTSTVEATHAAAGKKVYTSEYGVVEVEIPQIAHVWGAWEMTKEPTVEAVGAAKRVCACGEEDTAVVPVLTNTKVWTATVTEATHAAAGKTTYTSVYGTVEVAIPQVAHTPAADAVVVDGEDGKAELVYKCTEDDAVVGDNAGEMTKKIPCAFTFDEDVANPFTQDSENTNKWTSAPIGNSSMSYLKLTVITAGVLEFDYGINSEYADKLFVMVNGTQKLNGSTGIGGDGKSSNPNPDDVTGTFSISVEAGDKVQIYYKKDSSGVYGRDNAYVIFKSAAFQYNAMNFVTGGGSKVAPMFIENGKLVGDLPENPTKEGKFFEGWYIDEACETAYVAQTFEGNAHLYAKWSDALYVTLNTFEGDTVAPVAFQNGTTPKVDKPVREGYFFVGWYTDEALETAYTPAKATEGFNLYAKWIAKADANALYGEYKGAYVSNNSDSIVDSSVLFTVDTAGNYVLKTGYSTTETGTITAVGEDGVVTFTTTSSSDVKAIVYDEASGTVVVCYKYSNYSDYYYIMSVNNATSSKNDIKRGAILNNKQIFVDFKAGDTTKHIYIDANTKTIKFVDSFVVNGAVVDDASKASSAISVVVKKGDDVVKAFYANSSSYVNEADGYEGIYTNGDDKIIVSGAGVAIFNQIGDSSKATYTVVSAENKELYVKFAAIYRYTVVLDVENKTFTYTERKATATFHHGYEVEGAEVVTTQDVKVETYETPTTPEREGYTFLGWYANAELTGSKVTSINITEATSYYAKWAQNFEVTVHMNDGSENTTIAFYDGATPNITTPKRQGYEFKGWFTDSDLSVAYVSGAKNASFDIYAKWEELNLEGTSQAEAKVVTITTGDVSTSIKTNESYQDYYLKFVITEANAGKYMFNSSASEITLEGGNATSKYYAKYDLIDSEGTKLISSGDMTASSATAKVLAAGTYYVKINLAAGNTYNAWGTAVFHIYNYAQDEASEAVTITKAQKVEFAVGAFASSSETKVYKFVATENATYALTGKCNQTSVYIKAYDNAELTGTAKASLSVTTANKNAVVDFTVESGKTYYIVVSNNWSASQLTTATAEFVIAEYAQGFTPSNPIAYTLGASADVTSTGGQYNYYSFTVAAKDAYLLDVSGGSSSGTKQTYIYKSTDLSKAVYSVTSGSSYKKTDITLEAGTYIIKTGYSSTYYTDTYQMKFEVLPAGVVKAKPLAITLGEQNTAISGIATELASSEHRYYTIPATTVDTAYVFTSEKVYIAVYDGDTKKADSKTAKFVAKAGTTYVLDMYALGAQTEISVSYSIISDFVASPYAGTYLGYNCCGTTKSGDLGTTYAADINDFGVGISGKLNNWSITSVAADGKAEFTKADGTTGKGTIVSASDGTKFIIIQYSAPNNDYVAGDTAFMVEVKDQSKAKSYTQSKEGDVFTINVTLDTTVYIVKVNPAADTVTVSIKPAESSTTTTSVVGSYT